MPRNGSAVTGEDGGAAIGEQPEHAPQRECGDRGEGAIDGGTVRLPMRFIDGGTGAEVFQLGRDVQRT
jgi:hypothetical protein